MSAVTVCQKQGALVPMCRELTVGRRSIHIRFRASHSRSLTVKWQSHKKYPHCLWRSYSRSFFARGHQEGTAANRMSSYGVWRKNNKSHLSPKGHCLSRKRSRFVLWLKKAGVGLVCFFIHMFHNVNKL